MKYALCRQNRNYCLINGKIYFHGTNQGGHKAANIGTGCPASFTVVGSTELLPSEFGTKFSSAMDFIGSCFDRVGIWCLNIDYVSGKARK